MAWHDDTEVLGGNQQFIEDWLVSPQIAIPAGVDSVAFSFMESTFYGAWIRSHGAYITTGVSQDPGVSAFTPIGPQSKVNDGVWDAALGHTPCDF